MYRATLFVVLLIVVVTLTACKTASSSTATPQGGNVTAGEMVEQGKVVFGRSCAGCHGAQGQGGNAPALIGMGENLKKYADAQKLYEKMSTTMPRGAPGSLSQEDYLRLLSFILVENNLVPADKVMTTGTLSEIKLQ